jgi:site-specific DNA-cytosine methylase
VLVGGTPCVDHSQAGARKRDDGVSIVIFLAFCLKILAMEIPIAIHENVSEFPESWLHSMLGSTYHIVSIVINTSFVAGCHISRKRRYTLCFHKRKTRFLCDPLALYGAIVNQLSLIRPSLAELYLASREELVAEACSCLPTQSRGCCVRDEFVTAAAAKSTAINVHRLFMVAVLRQLPRPNVCRHDLYTFCFIPPQC